MAAKQTPQRNASAGLGVPANPKAKVKKPKKKANPALICIVVFVLLIGGAGACLYLNVGGAAEKTLVLLPAYKQALADLDKQKQILSAQQGLAKQQQDKADQSAKDNEKAAAAVKAAQDQLAAAQKAFDAKQQQAVSATDKQKALVEIYSNLEAEVAATMLMQAPSVAEAAGVLKLLPQDKAAAILEAIAQQNPRIAYNIAKQIGQ